MSIRFHLDEHVNPAIAMGLRLRGIDVSTTNDVGLRSAPDQAHISYAVATQRVIFTNDDDFLRLNAAGVEHCGIVFNYLGTKSLGQIIEYLALIHGCMSEYEMINRVQYI